VDVSISGELPAKLTEERVAQLVREAGKHQGTDFQRVEIAFVSPEEIQSRNRADRATDKPTDVLSYPFDSGFPQGAGGQLLVCSEVVLTQTPPGTELQAAFEEVLVHGLLHLAGMRDDTAADAAGMRASAAAVLGREVQYG
jgi:probable rRNA maturation factor